VLRCLQFVSVCSSYQSLRLSDSVMEPVARNHLTYCQMPCLDVCISTLWYQYTKTFVRSVFSTYVSHRGTWLNAEVRPAESDDPSSRQEMTGCVDHNSHSCETAVPYCTVLLGQKKTWVHGVTLDWDVSFTSRPFYLHRKLTR